MRNTPVVPLHVWHTTRPVGQERTFFSPTKPFGNCCHYYTFCLDWYEIQSASYFMSIDPFRDPANAVCRSQGIRLQLLKWAVAVLLGAMLVGGVTLVWVPVHRYAVTCQRVHQISCIIEQETYSGLKTWQIPLGDKAVAIVRVEPMRRSSDRVSLYLNTESQAIFAAQFETSSAVADAQAAAAQLNRVFSTPSPISTRIETRPPAYLGWIAWGGIGLLALFVLVIYRELFKPELRPNN